MYYVSPVNGAKTRCLYIRDDHGKAVVFFEHAEWAARVGYDQLEKIMCALILQVAELTPVGAGSSLENCWS